MAGVYFEEKGAELLKIIGLSKTEFAKRMGIKKQNVNALFRTKNIETIRRAAEVLGVRFELLIGFTEEPSIDDDYIPEDLDSDNIIKEEDVPRGDTVEDRRKRQKLIIAFYQHWKKDNPESKRYNINLKDDINIRYVSIEETAGQASLTYYSTIAVLQLDAILTNAVLKETVPANQKKNNQRKFESILKMEYECVAIGRIKMLVGVKRSDKSKVQYCITAIRSEK
ncbi:MAG: helix-turn-helix transcriptional regulator [Bacteroidales bacterium]|nr:helix-turn-helix transcriptional regulator [Bacteroidales bacterium]